jgi:hypothetical protein
MCVRTYVQSKQCNIWDFSVTLVKLGMTTVRYCCDTVYDRDVLFSKGGGGTASSVACRLQAYARPVHSSVGMAAVTVGTAAPVLTASTGKVECSFTERVPPFVVEQADWAVEPVWMTVPCAELKPLFPGCAAHSLFG